MFLEISMPNVIGVTPETTLKGDFTNVRRLYSDKLWLMGIDYLIIKITLNQGGQILYTYYLDSIINIFHKTALSFCVVNVLLL